MNMFLALRVRHPAAPPARHRSPASEPHASPPSHTDHTDHTVIRSYGGLALRHLPRLPGIEASRAAPPARHRSLQPAELAPYRGRNSDFAFLPEKPITGPAPKVRQRCRPRSIADSVFFFTIHTPSRQSWRGHRIATLNPGVGTGLPHSILAWAQDCHTQSWRGHRIAPVFPRKRWKRSAVQHYALRLAARIARKKPAVRRYTAMHSRTRRPDCPENYGSALLYSRTLPENSGCDAVNTWTTVRPHFQSSFCSRP